MPCDIALLALLVESLLELFSALPLLYPFLLGNLTLAVALCATATNPAVVFGVVFPLLYPLCLLGGIVACSSHPI